MKFTKCPLCESPLIQQKKGKYGFEIKGKIIPSPVIEYWECPSCGEAFFDQIANKKIDKEMLVSKKQKSEVIA